MTKRSPNYPAIGLEEAIKKTKAIYEQEHKNATDKAVIAKHLGYNGLNGASLTTISALTKYGLLEAIGAKQLKVSAAAESIIWLEKGNPERVKLLKEAAFAPSLFSDLRDAFPEKLPSDQSLRYHLIKKEFNPNTVDSAIRAYRDTLEFVNAEDEALETSAIDGSEQPAEEPMQTQPQPTSNSSSSYQANTNGIHAHANPSYCVNTNGMHASTEQGLRRNVFAYPLTESCTAHVEFDGEVTLEALETLIDSIGVYRNVLRRKESQKSSNNPQSDKLPSQRELLQQAEVSGSDEA